MPSGRLAFATRRVDLMAASMRAPLALCTDGMTILPPPTKRGKKSTRWWFEFKERLTIAQLNYHHGRMYQPSPLNQCPHSNLSPATSTFHKSRT